MYYQGSQADVNHRPFYCNNLKNQYGQKLSAYVIGQEAKDFGSYLSDWPIEDIQEFNKEYVEIQLGYKQPTKDIKRNNSPFWYLFRDLKSHGLEPVWNNVDKFHRLSNDNKTESLNLEIERLLNKSYGSDNKSLLTREIEISNPDIIVFVVGPYYHESMALSLGIEDDELIKYKPTKDAKCNCIKDIYDSDILVLWSYHPAYLNRVKSIGSIYENIKRRH